MVHQAGPLVDGVQRCTRCGRILVDYRNAAGVARESDVPLRGWAEGANIDAGEFWSRAVPHPTDAAATCRR
ncbi:MAG: hypothetical protein ACRD3C_10800 [Vicinamibacterales bacterium]